MLFFSASSVCRLLSFFIFLTLVIFCLRESACGALGAPRVLICRVSAVEVYLPLLVFYIYIAKEIIGGSCVSCHEQFSMSSLFREFRSLSQMSCNASSCHVQLDAGAVCRVILRVRVYFFCVWRERL